MSLLAFTLQAAPAFSDQRQCTARKVMFMVMGMGAPIRVRLASCVDCVEGCGIRGAISSAISNNALISWAKVYL